MLGQNHYQKAYQALKQKYEAQVGSTPKMQPSSLRVEAILANNKSEFRFQISNTKQGDITLDNASYERRLDRNNVFKALEHSFAMYEMDTSTNVPKSLIYSPVPGYFTTGGATFDLADLEQLYQNGRFNIKVDTQEYVSGSLRLNDFRFVPQTQDQTLTTDEATPVNTATNALTQTPPNGGYKPLLLPVTFYGNKQNALSISCDAPSGIAWAQDASNKEIRLVWRFLGVEVWDVLD